MASVTTLITANANAQAAYASRALPHKQYLGPNFTLVTDPAQKASYADLHTCLDTLEKGASSVEKPLYNRTEILLKALYPQPKQESAPVQATAEKVDQKKKKKKQIQSLITPLLKEQFKKNLRGWMESLLQLRLRVCKGSCPYL